MIVPSKLKEYAKAHQAENKAFCFYLKEHAIKEQLDEQFFHYHKEYFEQYDCNQCLNCCKELAPIFEGRELETLAKASGFDVEDILNVCEQVSYDSYQVMDEEQCPFLTEKGCCIPKKKPECCKDFPYTNQGNRMESLFGMLSLLPICPILYEIYEQLKKDYGFTYEK